jgi:hypothetical protein
LCAHNLKQVPGADLLLTRIEQDEQPDQFVGLEIVPQMGADTVPTQLVVAAK